MELEIPYICMADPCEFMKSTIAHDVCPTDSIKRVRVLKGQLMGSVLENINSTNYMFHVSIFFKYAYRLAKKYPEHFDEIELATVLFWSAVQSKLKNMKEGSKLV